MLLNLIIAQFQLYPAKAASAITTKSRGFPFFVSVSKMISGDCLDQDLKSELVDNNIQNATNLIILRFHTLL